MADDADVIIVGAGLAGLVAAAELAEAGKKIIIVDQEPEQSLGGQAFWSLGGIFLVNSPGRRPRPPKRPEITRLSDTTPFGHAVTHCTFASEEPTASAKLWLIVDVAKFS